MRPLVLVSHQAATRRERWNPEACPMCHVWHWRIMMMKWSHQYNAHQPKYKKNALICQIAVFLCQTAPFDPCDSILFSSIKYISNETPDSSGCLLQNSRCQYVPWVISLFSPFKKELKIVFHFNVQVSKSWGPYQRDLFKEKMTPETKEIFKVGPYSLLSETRVCLFVGWLLNVPATG